MIVQVKVQKGGTGKSFISANLAHLISLVLENQKTLILTTDTQNSILDLFKDEYQTTEKGLLASINDKKIYNIKLRDNLDFIPLEKDAIHLNNLNQEDVKEFLEFLNKEYKYIIIDSSPTLNIDDLFLNLADKIIIPAVADKLTVNGIISILEKQSDKVAAILFNKYNYRINLHNFYYNEIKEICKGTSILIPDPIPQWQYLTELSEKGKTIWESKSQKEKLNNIKNIFISIVRNII